MSGGTADAPELYLPRHALFWMILQVDSERAQLNPPSLPDAEADAADGLRRPHSCGRG